MSAMDLISRISEHFSESAHLKLQSMDVLATPIAELKRGVSLI